MWKIMKVNGPRGVLPCMFYDLDGKPIPNERLDYYMECFLSQLKAFHTPKEGDLVVYISQQEFEQLEKNSSYLG